MHRHYAHLIWHKHGISLRIRLFGIFLFWWVNALWIAAVCLWRVGGKVRRITGKPVWRQTAEILYVDLRYSISPDFYYKYELFRPERMRDAKHYLMRYEFKGGWHNVVEIAESLARGPGSGPTSGQIINDKAAFGLVCRQAGVSAAPPLLKVDAEGRVIWLDHRGPDLPRGDLFCKPNKSKGGRGCERWRWCGGDRYSNGERELSEAELFGRLRMLAAKRGAYVVQPCLDNHPDIADLGQGTLTTCRFLSLRNEHGEIEVTHAMYKLAFRKNAVVDNFHAGGSVAAVDMATGRLGPASDSGLKEPCVWLTHHPVAGTPIEGRVMPMWKETVELVKRAHRRFSDRVMIGWDVAFTPDGPCIVEGNVQSATDMVQRTHAAPAGKSRLAEIFAFHLDRAPRAARAGRKFIRTETGWIPAGWMFGSAPSYSRSMKQFWAAWCLAILLLSASIVGFGAVVSFSTGWPMGLKVALRAVAGLAAVMACYEAYRLAVRGTEVLQDVLAQSLAVMVKAELESLQAMTSQRKQALISSSEIGRPQDLASLGLAVPRGLPQASDVGKLLGHATEDALCAVLDAIEDYNRLVGSLAADGQPRAGRVLAGKIEEVSERLGRALSAVRPIGPPVESTVGQ
jgi:hypothetical protein